MSNWIKNETKTKRKLFELINQKIENANTFFTKYCLEKVWKSVGNWFFFQFQSSFGSVLILIRIVVAAHEDDDEQHEDAVEERAPDECARILLRSSRNRSSSRSTDKHTNHTTWRIDPDRSWCATVDARHTSRTSESAFDIDQTSMAFERRRFEDDEPNCFCRWTCSDSSRIDIESPNESLRCVVEETVSFHTIYHIVYIRIVLLLTKQ